jgi:transposase
MLANDGSSEISTAASDYPPAARKARQLLADSSAVVTSDRWWAYNHVPVARRPVCWSHLRRDLQAQREGIGAEHELGRVGLEICDELFFAWEAFQHARDRRQLTRVIRRLQRRLKPILRTYVATKPRYNRTRGLAKNLLKLWPGLWTFTTVKGVTPTDNHAERALRGAVIYRKLSLGCSQRTPPAASQPAASSNTSPPR